VSAVEGIGLVVCSGGDVGFAKLRLKLRKAASNWGFACGTHRI